MSTMSKTITTKITAETTLDVETFNAICSSLPIIGVFFNRVTGADGEPVMTCRINADVNLRADSVVALANACYRSSRAGSGANTSCPSAAVCPPVAPASAVPPPPPPPPKQVKAAPGPMIGTPEWFAAQNGGDSGQISNQLASTFYKYIADNIVRPALERPSTPATANNGGKILPASPPAPTGTPAPAANLATAMDFLSAFMDHTSSVAKPSPSPVVPVPAPSTPVPPSSASTLASMKSLFGPELTGTIENLMMSSMQASAPASLGPASAVPHKRPPSYVAQVDSMYEQFGMTPEEWKASPNRARILESLSKDVDTRPKPPHRE